MFAKFLGSALLSASVCLGAVASTAAAPLPAQPAAETGNLLVQVDHRHHYRGHHRGFHKRDGHYYYNGKRGYRHKRPGYRYHNGYWFPAAAFALGLLIAPEIRQGRTIQLTPAHYRWCDDRYKSYRKRDNSWQPYHGPRKQCISPYMR